jgi:hypothetical protein
MWEQRRCHQREEEVDEEGEGEERRREEWTVDESQGVREASVRAPSLDQRTAGEETTETTDNNKARKTHEVA